MSFTSMGNTSENENVSPFPFVALVAKSSVMRSSIASTLAPLYRYSSKPKDSQSAFRLSMSSVRVS